MRNPVGFQESADKLNSALKVEPNALAPRYLLGLSYYRLQRFEDARKEFTSVVEIVLDYTLAIFYLGLANARVGDFDGAIAALKRALELDATNFSAALTWGVASAKETNPRKPSGASPVGNNLSRLRGRAGSSRRGASLRRCK